MIDWVSKKRYTIIVTFIGGTLGYLYWYFIGCRSGSCAITSVWWRSTIYGIIMGWLLGDLINDKRNKQITDDK